MRIIGIDCGVTGAVCCLDGDALRIIDTPTEKVKVGKVSRTHYLPVEMRRILVELLDGAESPQIVIEHVNSMPRDGVVQAFSLGYGFGLWVGLLHGLGHTPLLVKPSVWKKKLQLSSDKEESRLEALALYPQARHFLTLKKHHNRAESLLLAHYGKEIIRVAEWQTI